MFKVDWQIVCNKATTFTLGMISICTCPPENFHSCCHSNTSKSCFLITGCQLSRLHGNQQNVLRSRMIQLKCFFSIIYGMDNHRSTVQCMFNYQSQDTLLRHTPEGRILNCLWNVMNDHSNRHQDEHSKQSSQRKHPTQHSNSRSDHIQQCYCTSRWIRKMKQVHG